MKRILFMTVRILIATILGLVVGGFGIVIKSEEFRNAVKGKLSRVVAKIRNLRLR